MIYLRWSLLPRCTLHGPDIDLKNITEVAVNGSETHLELKGHGRRLLKRGPIPIWLLVFSLPQLRVNSIITSNALLFVNSYRQPRRNPQNLVDTLMHLIHEEIPAIAAVTVITAVHIKQVVAVLKRHASVLGNGIVYAAELLERKLVLFKNGT